MNIKKSLTQAELLFRSGKHQESIKICQDLLAYKPNLFNAHGLLGLNYQAVSNYQQALHEFKNALKLNSKHADTYNNLGNVYLELEDFKQASRHYSKALQIEPMMAEAIHNLGLCRYELGDQLGADEHFRKAIMIDPNIPEFYRNLGILLTDQGKFDTAEEALFKSISLKPDNSRPYWEMCLIKMYQHRYQDAIEVAEMGLSCGSVPEPSFCQFHIGRAIIFWLFSQYEETAQAIRLSKGIEKYSHLSKVMTNMARFHRYIDQLLAIKAQHPELYLPTTEAAPSELYFISESHCLSPNGVIVNYGDKEYQIRSLFILGAKVFHFTTPEDNKYQVSLATILEGLPSGSKIVLGFGEIDCRNNEGLYTYCLKSGKDHQTVIKGMLSEYTSTLKKIADAYQLEIIFYGVPAPHPAYVNELDCEQQEVFKDIVRCFNDELGYFCEQYEIPLLDVYKLTNRNGQSNLKYHIDGIHLSPNIMPELFKDK